MNSSCFPGPTEPVGPAIPIPEISAVRVEIRLSPHSIQIRLCWLPHFSKYRILLRMSEDPRMSESSSSNCIDQSGPRPKSPNG